MVLLFFKVFSSMIYLLLHALKPLVEALFPLLLRHLQNMVFERFNSIFCRRKSFPRTFSGFAEIKRSYWVPRPVQKGAGLSRCVRARIGMVNNYSSSHVRFSNDDALSPNKNFSLSMNSCRDNPRRML